MDFFLEKAQSQKSTSDEKASWKILVVDDEKSIHDVTKLVLNGLSFENKTVSFLHAYNIDEAQKLVQDNPEIALILLDVVMEKDDSGLTFVKFIREQMKNDLVRIILRTGQPGIAPENKVIMDYDINDYKEKTELTSNKLKTVVITSLRSYRDLQRSKQEQFNIQERAQQIITEKENYLKLLADALPVLISFIDKDQGIKFSNKTYEVWFDKTNEEIIGLKIETLIGSDAYNIYKSYWNEASTGHSINFDMQLNHSHLGLRNTNITLVPHFFNGDFKGCFSLITDITERKQIEENLNYLATHDVLTDLFNRTYFDAHIPQAIKNAEQRKKLIGILFLDIDGFKKINDTLGHEYGDMLLLSLSARLKECLRKADLIARFGGDEFIIMLENIDTRQEITAIIDKILKAMAKPFLVNQKDFLITVSIGVSVYPDDGSNKETLIKNADLAMYYIKGSGKNSYQFYTNELYETAYNRFNIETDLPHALERKEFELYYQPVYDFKSGLPVSVEGLIRWHHPERGLILPTSFIPIAEETGMINAISQWVLATACTQIKEFHKQNPDLKLSINISAKEFILPTFVERIEKILKETNFPGDKLSLELTENILISNFDMTLSNIEKLNKLGINVVLDDFGTGFSSLNYLRRLPISAIKIDESFSKVVTTDLRSAAIISTITQLMHTLGIKIVIEAIETREQLLFISSCGCDMAQGFLLAPPVPFADLGPTLKNQPNITESFNLKK